MTRIAKQNEIDRWNATTKDLHTMVKALRDHAKRNFPHETEKIYESYKPLILQIKTMGKFFFDVCDDSVFQDCPMYPLNLEKRVFGRFPDREEEPLAEEEEKNDRPMTQGEETEAETVPPSEQDPNIHDPIEEDDEVVPPNEEDPIIHGHLEEDDDGSISDEALLGIAAEIDKRAAEYQAEKHSGGKAFLDHDKKPAAKPRREKQTARMSTQGKAPKQQMPIVHYRTPRKTNTETEEDDDKRVTFQMATKKRGANDTTTPWKKMRYSIPAQSPGTNYVTNMYIVENGATVYTGSPQVDRIIGMQDLSLNDDGEEAPNREVAFFVDEKGNTVYDLVDK